ncbi:hypothetical protein GGI42DRAFT_313799, partial [Trichoderma sp. SZMC 28013]
MPGQVGAAKSIPDSKPVLLVWHALLWVGWAKNKQGSPLVQILQPMLGPRVLLSIVAHTLLLFGRKSCSNTSVSLFNEWVATTVEHKYKQVAQAGRCGALLPASTCTCTRTS